MTIIYDEQGNAIGHTKLMGSNIIDSAILEANPNTTTYTLPIVSKRLAVQNMSRYVAVWVKVNGKNIRISPGQWAKFHGENITSMDYSSAVGKAQIQVVMGETDVSMSNIEPISRAYMEKSPWQILAVRGNEMYRISSSYSVSYSSNQGLIWSTKKDWNPIIPVIGWITKAKTLLLLCNDGKLYRSTDKGANFTEVIASVRDLRSGSVLEVGSTIIVAEYGTTDGTYNVWRSTNDGATFTPVLAKTCPTDIRHFHGVSYDHFGKKWYVFSGDGDTQSIWFSSADDGATFTPVIGASGSQLWRTLNLFFVGNGEVVWASDSDSPAYKGIWKAKLSDLANAVMKLSLDGTPLGGFKVGNNIAIYTRHEGAPTYPCVPGIFVSRDDGNMWLKELEWPISPSAFSSTGVGGFENNWGPDCDGTYYIYAHSNLLGRGLTPDWVMGMKFRF